MLSLPGSSCATSGVVMFIGASMLVLRALLSPWIGPRTRNLALKVILTLEAIGSTLFTAGCGFTGCGKLLNTLSFRGAPAARRGNLWCFPGFQTKRDSSCSSCNDKIKSFFRSLLAATTLKDKSSYNLQSELKSGLFL